MEAKTATECSEGADISREPAIVFLATSMCMSALFLREVSCHRWVGTALNLGGAQLIPIVV